jgi:hypothetical protein
LYSTMTSSVCGAARLDLRDQRTRARLQPEVTVRVNGDRQDLHADAASRHFAGVQLRQKLANRVDRNREADPDVALSAAVADDGRVHPDDLASDVQQRATRIARVDRGVGL